MICFVIFQVNKGSICFSAPDLQLLAGSFPVESVLKGTVSLSLPPSLTVALAGRAAEQAGRPDAALFDLSHRLEIKTDGRRRATCEGEDDSGET